MRKKDILNVIDVQTQHNVSGTSENTNNVDTSMSIDKTFDNTAAKRNKNYYGNKTPKT